MLTTHFLPLPLPLTLTLTLTTLFSLSSLSLAYPQGQPHARRNVTSANKAGLAWGGGDGSDMEQFTTTDKVTWYYTWSPKNYITDAPSQLEYVPMLWGSKQTEEFAATINETLDAGDVHVVLGMNEPQESAQSNLTPAEGAAMWREYLNPLHYYYPGVELGSPAPSGAPSGKTWLLDFLEECDDCTVDFIACHWYDINATDFIAYMEDFHATFNRPIAITEWSCQNFNSDDQSACTDAGVVEFLNATQSWMDATEWIRMYAYFGALTDMQGVNSADRLRESDGDITALGKQYIGAQGPDTSGGGDDDSDAAVNVVSYTGSRLGWLFGALLFMQLSAVFVV